jgi:ribosomal protein S18 acetylase RimI-like enzyme
MIEYVNDIKVINEDMLSGFFVGWLNQPSQSVHLKILKGSYCIWLAIDTDTNKVVGFINSISDGVLSAHIPLLEVLPEYQSNGIGKQLVRLMLGSLKDFYSIDLFCDEELLGYYTKFGMKKAIGSFFLYYDRQSGE